MKRNAYYPDPSIIRGLLPVNAPYIWSRPSQVQLITYAHLVRDENGLSSFNGRELNQQAIPTIFFIETQSSICFWPMTETHSILELRLSQTCPPDTFFKRSLLDNVEFAFMTILLGGRLQGLIMRTGSVGHLFTLDTST